MEVERVRLLGSAAGMGSDPSLLIWRAPDAALLATRRAATARVAPPLPSVDRSIDEDGKEEPEKKKKGVSYVRKP
jgi:hypothetical protein